MNPGPVSAAKSVLNGVREKVLPSPALADAHTDPTHWRAVTILCDEQQLAQALERMSSFDSALETRLAPAPAGRGTELAMRAHSQVDPSQPIWGGVDPAEFIRGRLRQIKQQLETGEVLVRDPQPEGRRSKTPAGAVVDKADAAAGKEGVL